MSNNRALSMLSLAAKAGKVVSGGFMTEKAIQEGKAFLVIVAEDASNNTKKRFINKSDYYDIPYIVYESMDNLGKAIGKEARTSMAVIDSGFAKQISIKIGVQKDMEV